jgi:hypothetical protein
MQVRLVSEKFHIDLIMSTYQKEEHREPSPHPGSQNRNLRVTVNSG